MASNYNYEKHIYYMTAKEELISNIGNSKILCAEISIHESAALLLDNTSVVKKRGSGKSFNFSNNPIVELDKKGMVNIRLFPGYSTEDWENFLLALEFDYDSGYGGQNLYGYIWMEDGTWLSRGEYDGSEWWDWERMPELPVDFQRALSIEKVIGKEIV